MEAPRASGPASGPAGEEPPGRPVLLDLGSGPRVVDGWIAIDASWNGRLARHPRLHRLLGRLGLISDHHRSIRWPREGILFRDVRHGLPFASATVDGIFAAHFLEHLTPAEASALLLECRRVLVPGGGLRVIVPDLAALVAAYRAENGDPAAGPAAAGRFLERLNLAGTQERPGCLAWRLAGLVSRPGHRAVYDRAALEQLIQASGFRDLRTCGLHESRIPEIARVEEPRHHELALCMEGRAPG